MKTALRVFALAACVIPAVAFAQSGKPAKRTKQKPATQQSQPAQTESAQESQPSLHDRFSGQGYGFAGCGLGSVVFGPKPGPVQIIAATVNGTAGSQTFGITSGTSNCDIPQMGQQAALYIETNQETLRKEAARGAGDTVEGLALILNCSDAAVFGTKLRENFVEVMDENANSYEKSRRILNVIKRDSQLQKSCAVIG